MTGPWRRRDFRLIWGGGLVNDTGDWVLAVALPVYVLTETGSGVTTALLFIAQLAPAVLFGPIAGHLVDRWNLRRTLIATNLAQAIALLPLLAVTAHRTWPIFAVAIAQSVLTRLNNPAATSLLVRVVADAELPAANAARATAENLARLVGSPLGGILVAVGGLPAIVAVDALSFVAVAAATFAVRGETPAACRTTGSRDRVGLRGATRHGLGALRRTRPVPALAVTTTISQIAQGMFVVLFLAFVLDRLGGDGADVGIIRGTQAVGGVIGGLVIGRFAARVTPAALIGLGFGGMALWGLVTWNLPAITTHTAVYAAMMGFAGPAATACTVGLVTAIQRAAPPAHLGLCVGTIETTGAAGQALGAVGAGLLLDRIPLAALLNAQALIYASVAVYGWLTTRPPIELPRERGEPAGRHGLSPMHRRPEGSTMTSTDECLPTPTDGLSARHSRRRLRGWELLDDHDLRR